MKGYKPDGGDFNFISNGYKCAIGVNTDAIDAGGESFMLVLTKQKQAGGPDQTFQDWELVHHLNLESRTEQNPTAVMSEFLAVANPKLITATGGEVPPVPEKFLDQVKHLCRYSLAFNASTGEVFLK
jgi:hypothetical protein